MYPFRAFRVFLIGQRQETIPNGEIRHQRRQGYQGSTLLHPEAVTYLQTIVMASDIGKKLLLGALEWLP